MLLMASCDFVDEKRVKRGASFLRSVERLRRILALRANVFETVEYLAGDPIRRHQPLQDVLQCVKWYSQGRCHLVHRAGTASNKVQHALSKMWIALQPVIPLEVTDDLGCVRRKELSHRFHFA